MFKYQLKQSLTRNEANYFYIEKNTALDIIKVTSKTKLNTVLGERKQPAFTIERSPVLGIMKAVCF